MRYLQCVASAVLFAVSTLFFAIPGSAQQPSPVLSPEARAGLLDAAESNVLPAWQREFMVEMAGRGSLVDSTAASSSSSAGTWDLLPPPSARDLHSAVYDPVRDRMIVFGGYSTRDLVNDVWVLSLAGTPEWSRLLPAGTPPSPRHLMSAIYDPVRDRVVVFGGLDRVAGYRDDVWVLSLDATPTWSQIVPSDAGPAARARHSAVYDPVRDRMIVFGGYRSNGAGAGRMNDAWALSLSDPPSWTQLSPAGPLPSARYDQSAVYDTRRDRVVVFGGFDDQVRLNDVWTLSLAGRPRWRQLNPTGPLPTPRLEHAAIYDPAADRMVVFSGLADGYVSDTWTLSLGGRVVWTRLSAPSEPSVRWGHSAIYDPVRARMVIFGGTKDGSRLVSEVWGLSLSGAPTWTDLTTPDTPPGLRRGHTAVYDAAHARMLVFGGYDEQSGYLNDVWTLSLAGKPVWTMLRPSGTAPSPREGHTAVFDPVRNRMLVYGGRTYPFGDVTNEVWALSLTGEPAWTLITPVGPAPMARANHTAIYDAAHDQVVVFGGASTVYLGDVWALSLSPEPKWINLVPSGTRPIFRFEHSAIYDPVRERMVVFGGIAQELNFMNDVWALSLSGSPAWTKITTSGATPDVRSGHTAVYDAARDRMVVFGGFNFSAGSAPGAETWALSLGSAAWTLLRPAGTPADSRELHSAICDVGNDRMLVFAGHGVSNDLWELRWGLPAAPATAGVTPNAPRLAPRIAPNPSRGAVTISFTLAQSGEASVRIYDIAGRCVRDLAARFMPAGPRTIVWDRRTSAGVLAEPGSYFCEVRANAVRSVRRIVLVR